MLLRSIAAVCGHEPRVRGLLVGDGPEMPDMRALVDGLGLQRKVAFTGFRDDARELAQCMVICFVALQLE